jgi:hypothetical protein
LKKYRVGIIDLITNAPSRSFYERIMAASESSIMAQVIATWCEDEGHEVQYFTYTGFENLIKDMPSESDIIFISSFTHSAQLAYALSNFLRSTKTITVLGGPHARCYHQDARNYFDYVVGFATKTIIQDILHDCAQHRPQGIYLSADKHPTSFPGIRARWKYIQLALKKSPIIKFVPTTASFGCPYSCSYCIDSDVPYQILDLEQIQEDLKFFQKQFKKPRVVWCDPNFGMHFSKMMNAIEEAIPENSMEFIAESSLSLLTEEHLIRFRRNGFKAMLVGVESWFEQNKKINSNIIEGKEKVLRVAEQVNLVQKYIPYVQTNFVLGLDCDAGKEPFELTKLFIDLAPGVFPAYCMYTAFGDGTKQFRTYRKQNRIIPFSFHFLSNKTLNVRPKNYDWKVFYKNVIDMTKYSFSAPAVFKRFKATRHFIPAWLGVIRAVTSEGLGRINYYTEILQRLKSDQQMIDFFEQKTTKIPQFYLNQLQKDLGPLWDWLPSSALNLDIS